MKIIFAFLSLLALLSCSVQKRIGRDAIKTVINTDTLKMAHVGISIFEPATNKWWYNYQGDRYFVPASNVKIVTCYAAMKYLGDSLVAARLAVADDSALEVYPSGDPTFLHPAFQHQPLYEVLKKFKIIRWNLTDWQDQSWGSGWSWDDYKEDYMAERSPLPVYGNVVTFTLMSDTLKNIPSLNSAEKYFNTIPTSKRFSIERSIGGNRFYWRTATDTFKTVSMPFETSPAFISSLLMDTLKAENISTFSIAPGYNDNPNKTIIHSQLTDSVLRPMMHNSDNFLAEQSLLMVSNERLGVMNDEKIIDTLLKTDLADLPQKPRWVDGSGLSRYNLFTPQDFVVILNKMKTGFGMERLKQLFPTGGEGTFKHYFLQDSGAFFAKTGTMSGVVCLSGFLYTRKQKLLLFSVLVNNNQAPAAAVRRAVETFLQDIRKQY